MRLKINNIIFAFSLYSSGLILHNPCFVANYQEIIPLVCRKNAVDFSLNLPPAVQTSIALCFSLFIYYYILYVCFKFIRQEAVGIYNIPWPAKKNCCPNFLPSLSSKNSPNLCSLHSQLAKAAKKRTSKKTYGTSKCPFTAQLSLSLYYLYGCIRMPIIKLSSIFNQVAFVVFFPAHTNAYLNFRLLSSVRKAHCFRLRFQTQLGNSSSLVCSGSNPMKFNSVRKRQILFFIL